MEYDIPTGLYHTFARYYAPSIQRFLSEDPKGIGGGDINLFTYVANSPTNAIDPLGRDSSDLNGDYPNWMFVTPGFSSFDPLGSATQSALFASQQSPSTQTNISGGGQGGGLSINISSGGVNQQESSFNNGSENNEQVVNGSGGGSSFGSASSTPALGSNPGTTVSGLSSSSVIAIGGIIPLREAQIAAILQYLDQQADREYFLKLQGYLNEGELEQVLRGLILMNRRMEAFVAVGATAANALVAASILLDATETGCEPSVESCESGYGTMSSGF